uniref:Uncharacterized protein n=1 Tax=Fagus sylvatica TaxID=28930 RepID=A0A2N9GB03_FAGSY
MFEPSKHGSSSSGAAAEEIEDEDAEIDAAETVSDAETVAAEVNSADERTASGTFSGGEGMVAEASTEKDVVSIDELEAAEASFDDVPLASATVETTPIIITSSGGIAQGGLSGSGSHVDLSLLDSSPSTRQYVRRARRGSLVSTDSERTASVTVRVPTPSSPLRESGGTALTPIIIAAAVSAAATVQENMTHVEHAEVAASEEPVQADVTPGSGVPVIEEELAQDPVDDIDMGDTHDSYDEVLADAEDSMAGAQTADMEVTAPVAAHISPTKTAGSGSETIAEEERRLQTAAMESAIRVPVMPSISGLLMIVKANFEIFRVPRGGIRFLKALWEKYDSCLSYFRLGVHVGSSLLTLLCCVFAHMEHTRLEDITKVHILEWKAVVQEAIEGGFKFGFILDYLRRLAHDMFSRRILAELRVAEARVAALRDALDMVALDPWDLASARRVRVIVFQPLSIDRVCQGSSIRLRQPVVTTSMCFSDDVWSIPIGRELGWRCSNEAVAEGERRHQTAAVESASRGQLGLLSVAKSTTLGSSVLVEMDAFFREFDRMLVSSRHAEYFWIFDNVKVEFHGFRVPQGGVRFLEALWKKYGSCSAYLKLGVYIKGFMLTLLCLKRIVAGVTAAAYGVVAEAADDVVVKVADEVIAEIVENASNMQEVPAVNDVIVLGMNS